MTREAAQAANQQVRQIRKRIAGTKAGYHSCCEKKNFSWLKTTRYVSPRQKDISESKACKSTTMRLKCCLTPTPKREAHSLANGETRHLTKELP